MLFQRIRLLHNRSKFLIHDTRLYTGIKRYPQQHLSFSTTKDSNDNENKSNSHVAAAHPPPPLISKITEEEISIEKKRVEQLSTYQRTLELRNLDLQLKRLHTLRAINAGELDTILGKYKALARDYGIPLMVYYWVAWGSTFAITYAAIDFGGVDVISLLGSIDGRMGWSLADKVDPTLGTIGLAVVANEALEPLRLPFVVFTCKPVVDWFKGGD